MGGILAGPPQPNLILNIREFLLIMDFNILKPWRVNTASSASLTRCCRSHLVDVLSGTNTEFDIYVVTVQPNFFHVSIMEYQLDVE